MSILEFMNGAAVYKQLQGDFPDRAIRWVLSRFWSGPKGVPLDQIDYSNKDNWHASDDPEHVQDMVDNITSGDKKPIILVKSPHNPKLIVIDGHHRALAYLKLDMPAMAYVADVPSDNPGDPWMEMHTMQFSGKSGRKSG